MAAHRPVFNRDIPYFWHRLFIVSSTGLSAGGIVGIVLAVVAAICLALVVIFFFMNRDKSPAIAKDPGLPPTIGFDNALYKSSDKETTVQIGNTDPTSMDAWGRSKMQNLVDHLRHTSGKRALTSSFASLMAFKRIGLIQLYIIFHDDKSGINEMQDFYLNFAEHHHMAIISHYLYHCISQWNETMKWTI